ncbi:MAG: YfhO family protein [Lachnospiraceae bacterium]|nr:YfhO family protein [Lachnospiraceae bacterium]
MKKNETFSGSVKREIAKESLFFGLAFLLPLVIMALIWRGVGITYGGQVTPLIYDMRAQYMPFLASLRYLFSGENSLFYSGGLALGGNYYGLWAYYLASPLSFITLLFDLTNMPDAVYVLTLLKIGLCGLTFVIFVRFGLSDKRCGMTHVIFGCCYALMSYNVMYSMSVMWLDGVILFPLVLLGIEKMLQGKRGVIYYFTILAAFVCNYYTSYMIGIYAAVYVVCRVFAFYSKGEGIKCIKILARFGGWSILALGTAMPVLLPALQSISMGKHAEARGFEQCPVGAYQFTIADLVQKVLPGQYDSIWNVGLPSVYCGSIMVILALVYFAQRKHTWKEKIGFLLMLGFLVAGFLNRYLDYALHVFQYPTAFPYRYAFLFSITVLILAWRAYEQIPKDGDLVGLLSKIAGVYLLVELFFNGSAIINGLHQEINYVVRNAYNIHVEANLQVAESIKAEGGFARTEMSYAGEENHNHTMMYGLNGASGFVSTYHYGVNVFYNVIGAKKTGFVTDANDLTLVGDSLLGVKYRLSSGEQLDGYELKDVAEVSYMGNVMRMYLHENENALSLGYLVPSERIFSGVQMTTDPYINQNVLLHAMGVENNQVFRDVAYEELPAQEEGEWVIEFVATSEEPMYLYVSGERDPDEEKFVEWARGDGDATDSEDMEGKDCADYEIETADGKRTIRNDIGVNIYLGCFEEGEKVKITMNPYGAVIQDIYLYEMDMQLYESAMTQLKKKQLQVEYYRGGNVKGTVTAEEGEILLLTMPVDSGYRVLVDGVENTYGSVLGAFLAIPLTPGSHEIEISYVAPGFVAGTMIGLCSLVVVIACVVCGGKRRKKNLALEMENAEIKAETAMGETAEVIEMLHNADETTKNEEK